MHLIFFKRIFISFFLLLTFISFKSWPEESVLPHLNSPIVDNAHLFSQKIIKFVEQELYRLQQEGGPQIQVLSIESLEGQSIDQYTIKLMDQEKIGDAKKDDGLLFLISKNDRKMRIEVGQGLEGSLPDVNAKRIIEDIIKPNLRQGKIDQGLIQGLVAITSQVAPEFKWSQNLSIQSPNTKKPKDIFSVFALILIFLVISLFSRRGGLPFFGGGGGFGGGGFGGGGGGWSGGGGGFSGGGASGDW